MGNPEEEGYVLAAGREVVSDDFLGIRIYVKMSAREVDPRDKDWGTFYDAIEGLVMGLK